PADWVGPADCCPPMPVFIFNFGSGSASVFLFLNWRPPTLPHRLQCSTIGRPGLNHRVRDGNGCCPRAHRHQKILGSWRGFFEPRTKIVHRTWRSLFEPSKVNVFPSVALSSALFLPLIPEQ